MALSGNIRTDIRTGYAIQIAWTVDSQSVANNTSSVTARVQLVSTGASYTINSTATKNGTLTINGTAYSFTFSASLNGNQTKTNFTKTVTISHNSDGSKTCAFSTTCGINVTLSGTYYGNVTASGNGAFNTIPRASTISSMTGTVEVNGTNAITVNIARASSNFTHSVIFAFGSYSHTINNVGTSTSYAIPMSWLNAIPSATSGTGTVTITTYSGSTKIGNAVSRNFTATVPASVVPSISSVSLSEAVSGLAVQFQGYVQNKSKLAVSVASVGIYSSTIASVKTTIDGVTYSGASFTSGFLTKSGSITVSITVTDSRGRTASTTRTVTIIAYTPPKITSFQGYRCLSNGTENYDGTYLKAPINFSIASVNNRNTRSYKIEYKLQNASSWTTLTSGNVYAYNQNYISASGFMSADNAYQIRLTITDFFGSVSSTFDIPTGFTLVDFNANGRAMSFGKVSELTEGIEFNLPTKFLKSVDFAQSGKLLLAGSWLMHGSQTLQLPEPVSAQMNGIVLVFSIFQNDQAGNYWFNDFFVHKRLCQDGYGHQFILTKEGFEKIGTKTIYLGNTTISGHAKNTQSGTINGITYDNYSFVLRYVIGV